MESAPDKVFVAHLLAPSRVGGLESVIGALASAQAQSGDRVCVLLVMSPGDPQPHPLATTLSAASVEVIPLAVGVRAYWRERRRIGAALEKLAPSVLHTHGYRPDVIDAPLARKMGIPIVSTAHGYLAGGLKNRAYEWLQRRAFRRFDAVIAVSRELAEGLVENGVSSRRVHLVQNAWRPDAPLLDRKEARRRLELPEEGFVVGWVGRLSHEKGPDVAIRSQAILSSGDAVLCVLGGGPAEGECRALVSELNLTGSVAWRGVVPNASELLRAFDVLAITSRTEGTPMILLEAMGAQVPIVATAVGGVPDVVTSSEAILCRPDDPQAIAEAIDDVEVNSGAAMMRTVAARKRLESAFGPDQWVQQHRAVYRSVIDV